jgi:hypothetical protein
LLYYTTAQRANFEPPKNIFFSKMDFHTMSPGSVNGLLDRLSSKIDNNNDDETSAKRALFASPLAQSQKSKSKAKGLRKQHSNQHDGKQKISKSRSKRRKKQTIKQSQSTIVAVRTGLSFLL